MNDYQVFPKEYFSGADVYIAFNNVLLDEIVSIQMSMQEQKLPIYGYASFTYDAIAHGARIVQGSFRINFKESQYIRAALSKISLAGISSKTPKAPNTSNLSKDELIKWVKGKKTSDIEQIANGYEARLWGNKGKSALTKYDNPHFVNLKGSNGGYNPLLEYGFDIVLCFGDELLELESKVDEFPSTVKIINGVHLTGSNLIIQPTGEAIFEEYTFIAKDLDNTLTNLK